MAGESEEQRVIAQGIDDEPTVANQRNLSGWQGLLLFWLGVAYVAFHLISLNIYPIETWTYRIVHIAGCLVLGFASMAAWTFSDHPSPRHINLPERLLATVVLGTLAWPLFCMVYAFAQWHLNGITRPPEWVFAYYGIPLAVATGLALLASWFFNGPSKRIAWWDWALIGAAIAVAGYLVFSLDNLGLRMRAGTRFADPQNFWVAMVGTVLILELTRRVASMALVVIAGVFITYTFIGPFLPGFLRHQGYSIDRFFTYLYTDSGILGPTTAVSSTYIILFIVFAAFLQVSRVGEYFVNFAFAAAGRSRGGPAKVAIFGSGLMGMINGTSAGNVAATGSLTIPLMKRVGYQPKFAASVEAAASTGGQIMPPIMGAGAFIMAEVTGIPYTEIAAAAVIPAILYFAAVFFMVDFEAAKTGMRGMRSDELPVLRKMLKQAFLFIPIVMLIGALFMGYSVIRAGTLAMASAAVVSWLTPYRMGPVSIIRAFNRAAQMSIQIIAVCAAAGVIVGVISLTGVGARFSSLLLAVAETSQPLALFFTMCLSIILGMGMPTTAAYAVAAAVVAPGLIQLGVEPLIAHFFIFYFAVVSAITPPVALAAYAGAAIAGSNPMATSVTSFKLGLAAFIVPFMFFYSPALLMDGTTFKIIQVFVTASLGIFLLAAAVQGWFFGKLHIAMRVVLLATALMMIEGQWFTDVIGITVGIAMFLLQRMLIGRNMLTAAK